MCAHRLSTVRDADRIWGWPRVELSSRRGSTMNWLMPAACTAVSGRCRRGWPSSPVNRRRPSSSDHHDGCVCIASPSGSRSRAAAAYLGPAVSVTSRRHRPTHHGLALAVRSSAPNRQDQSCGTYARGDPPAERTMPPRSRRCDKTRGPRGEHAERRRRSEGLQPVRMSELVPGCGAASVVGDGAVAVLVVVVDRRGSSSAAAVGGAVVQVSAAVQCGV